MKTSLKALSKAQLEEAKTFILGRLYPLHVQKTEAEAAAVEIVNYLAKLEAATPPKKTTKKASAK